MNSQRMTGILCAAVLTIGGASGVAIAQMKAQPADKTVEKQSQQAQGEQKVKVTLLEAGEGEKSRLRMDLEPGSTQSTAMRMKTSQKVSMGGRAFPSPDMPTMIMPMSVSIGERAEEAEMKAWIIKFDFDEIELEGSDPQTRQAVKQGLAGFGEMSGTAVMNAEGRWADTEFAGQESLVPEMRDQLEGMTAGLTNMVAALPGEPVGIGGKWRVEETMESNGIRITQSIVYTLKSREGNRLTLDAEMKQSIPPQEVSPPNMPGQSFQTQGEGTGKGTLVVDLTKVMPVDGTMKSTTKMNMTSAQMQGMAMDMEIGTEMSVGER